jgi:hypothetical protein
MDNDRPQIVADGRERLQEAKDASVARQRIAAEVWDEFQEEFSSASFWRRLWLRVKIRRELRTRMDREFPPDALYLQNP